MIVLISGILSLGLMIYLLWDRHVRDKRAKWINRLIDKLNH